MRVTLVSLKCKSANDLHTEPYTTNIYSRRVLAGEFTVLNKYLLSDLMALGLWTPDLKNQIIADRGSIQNIDSIPQNIKDLYKTVWEIKMKDLMDMAADRGAFIDQSQSFNCFIAQPSTAKLTSMHFYAWKKGLKTGCYYLRSQNVVNAIQFTVDQRALQRTRASNSTPGTPVTNSSPVPTELLQKHSQTMVPASVTQALSPGLTAMNPAPLVTQLSSNGLDPSPSKNSPNSPTKFQPANDEVPNEGDICRMEEGCLVCGS